MSAIAGLDPRAAPFYILLPLLTRKEQAFWLLQLRGFAEDKRKRKEDQ